jgi:hypothetical protein
LKTIAPLKDLTFFPKFSNGCGSHTLLKNIENYSSLKGPHFFKHFQMVLARVCVPSPSENIENYSSLKGPYFFQKKIKWLWKPHSFEKHLKL